MKLTCPKCNSNKVKEIVYGLMSLDSIHKSDILGGCVIEKDSPRFHCISCQNEWGK